jgi:Domain of unknown function (DUF4457)
VTTGVAAQSWLAPRPPLAASKAAKSNTVTVVLPHAVALSKLRIWNYCKNPERGACEVDIFLDDHLIYFGYLRRASGHVPEHQTLLFSNHPGDIAAERAHVKYSVAEMDKNHLTLIDERALKNPGHSYVASRPPAIERPSTALVK